MINASDTPNTSGTPFGGGFYVGRIRVDNNLYALIVAPKAGGEFNAPWNDSRVSVPGAESYCDGLANTQAMAHAGSTLAAQVLELRIAEQSDWYLPSRDELELLYRNLKPSTNENAESFRDGDNPSSAPIGYPYTASQPAQTTLDAFREDGAEAFSTDDWYWSSTQYAPNPTNAWGQNFSDGYQNYGGKSYSARARAVRRLIIQ